MSFSVEDRDTVGVYGLYNDGEKTVLFLYQSFLSLFIPITGKDVTIRQRTRLNT